MAETPQTPAWSRRPSEDEREYLYFKAWLTCAHTITERKVDAKGVHHAISRDMRKTAKHLGVSLREVEEISKRREWTARARAYDDHCMAKVVDGQLDTLEDMRKRQNKTVDRAMSLLDAGLDAIQDAMNAKPSVGCETCAKYSKLDALSVARLDLPRLMDMVCHYQNLLHGEKTGNEVVHHEFGDDWDLSKLDDEDLRHLMRIKAKLRAAR